MTGPDDSTRRAVLKAALALTREQGYAKLDLAAVAELAGTDRAAIDQGWPSKSALVINAFRDTIARELMYAETGDFAADLTTQIVAMARILADAEFGPYLSELIAEAQHDPVTAQAFLDLVFKPNRAAARQRFVLAQQQGQLRRDLDLDTAIDLVFAPVWFRLLLRTAPLSQQYAERVVELALAGLRPA